MVLISFMGWIGEHHTCSSHHLFFTQCSGITVGSDLMMIGGAKIKPGSTLCKANAWPTVLCLHSLVFCMSSFWSLSLTTFQELTPGPIIASVQNYFLWILFTLTAVNVHPQIKIWKPRLNTSKKMVLCHLIRFIYTTCFFKTLQNINTNSAQYCLLRTCLFFFWYMTTVSGTQRLLQIVLYFLTFEFHTTHTFIQYILMPLSYLLFVEFVLQQGTLINC